MTLRPSAMICIMRATSRVALFFWMDMMQIIYLRL